MRKVLVVTSTRAEFGLLRALISEISNSAVLELQLVVTGMHLSNKFGNTYREIEEAGFKIDHKVEMLQDGDTPSSIAKSIGHGILGFSDAFKLLQPDLLLLLGDRFELLSAAIPALTFGIPVAHIAGGEVTEGAFDEAIRHSITKMSHLHFVGAEEYRQRVVQLGEHTDSVFMVGGLGIDAINGLDLLSREALENLLDIRLGEHNLLITFHPVTLEQAASAIQMQELLFALSRLNDTCLIFTMPNADTGSYELMEMVTDFVSHHPNAYVFSSLGQLRYLSCMSFVDGVVGNSSSGIAEAPSFGIGTINIGDRQKGRLMAESIINCSPERDAIFQSISKLYSSDFKRSLRFIKNPYGDGGATKRILRVLEGSDLKSIIKKSFYDFPVN